MEVFEPGNGRKPIKMWTDGVPVETSAINQLKNVASLPFIFKHVAVMPDVHWGMGATIGSVIATDGAICPAAVGLDIGCGVNAACTNISASDLPSDLVALRESIEAAVPHGRTCNGGDGDVGKWTLDNQPDPIREMWNDGLAYGFGAMVDLMPAIAKSNNALHLGTLGTGNHFIEVCLDETDRVWIMLHSGSRGVGNKIGQVFIKSAKEEMKRWMIDLPDPDLAYLPEGTELFADYIFAAEWAQNFAMLNRSIMMDLVFIAMGESIPSLCSIDEKVDCHHNYVAQENHFGRNVWVTRKGAVRAREGDLGIIPGSMGAKSLIVEGLGNRDSFNSCSHGAGRLMSRTAARKRFSVEDHEIATAGIECRKDEGALDETPAAYKDIDAVMEAQKDLVKIKHTLRQVICVKG